MRLACVMVVSVAVCGGVAQEAGAQVTFQKVADKTTINPAPAGIAPFRQLGTPAFDGRDVVFTGGFTPVLSIPAGIYRYRDGALSVVAAGGFAPAPASAFSEFDYDVSLAGGEVAFAATVMQFTGGNATYRGIFTTVPGAGANPNPTFTTVVDTRTNGPGGRPFTVLRQPSINAGRVAFVGQAVPTTVNTGVYTNVTGPVTLANSFNPFPLPNAGPSLDGGRVLVVNDTVPAGGIDLVDATSGTRTTVAAIGQPAPGGDGHTFVRFLTGTLDGTDAAFLASRDDRTNGVYALIDGALTTVADASTPIPGGTGTFTGAGGATRLGAYRSVAIDAGRVAFYGEGPEGQRGIYLYEDGRLSKIVDRSDTLSGQHPLSFLLGPQALVGNQLAFQASFADSTDGIYLATVPEPALLPVALLGLFALGRRRTK